jgi:hypothetical protein
MDLGKIKFFTKGMKLGKGVSVPIRKIGMTGSGRKLDCHSNVSKLVALYGGSDIRGYEVKYHEEEKGFSFNPHSVWKTPEGKLVDVTLNALGIKEDYFWFIPVFECFPNKGYYFSSVQMFVSEVGTIPLMLELSDHTIVTFSRKDCKRGKLKVADLWGHKEHTFFEEHPEKLDSDYPSFSKPSSATGKTFNEIWNERMVA